MKVGIGYCNKKDAFTSGREVAENAINNGNIDKPDIVFAFCSGTVDHDNFFGGLQSVVECDVPIIGGSAIGIITNNDLSYEGYPAGAAVVQSDTLQYRIAVAGDLNKGEKLAGKKIAAKLLSNTPGVEFLLLFYDSIKKSATETSPPVLNASSPLIEGIEEKLGTSVPIIGAGLVGDYEFTPTKQFCGSYVDSQSVVGIILNDDFTSYYRIMHGLTPLDGVYHTITRIKGSVIYELDNTPIVEIIDDIYGNQEWHTQHPVQLLALGVNYGKRYGTPDEANYVNRLITGVLLDGEGIGIFEPDFEEGTEIQFMLRDTREMIESAKTNSAQLMKQIEADGRKAVFGLYIDCAGRTASYSNISIEEATEVQNIFNTYNTPLLGFYSGVEIAPLIGKSRGLDWTGVLMVLAKG
ncbi:FIST signal transduction protein [Candidatus Latescibacterota bacterium]